MNQQPGREDLIELLKPLPASARRDYTAVEIDGIQPSAQAAELGISVATVSANVRRAKEILRQAYDLQPDESLANAYGEADAVFLDVYKWGLVLESLEAAAAIREQQGGRRDAQKLLSVVDEMRRQLGRCDDRDV